jgi:hypothetical protein
MAKFSHSSLTFIIVHMQKELKTKPDLVGHIITRRDCISFNENPCSIILLFEASSPVFRFIYFLVLIIQGDYKK